MKLELKRSVVSSLNNTQRIEHGTYHLKGKLRIVA